MEEAQIPALAWVAFGVALLAVLVCFGCVLLLVRRLDISWQRQGSSFSLAKGDATRVGKVLLGREQPPASANVQVLIWGARLSWLVEAAAIILFAVILAGAV